MKTHHIIHSLRIGITCIALLVGLGQSAFAQTRIVSGPRINLLKNANFEKGMEDWEVGSGRKLGTAMVDPAVMRNGKVSIRIENSGADDCHVKQKVTVKPMTRYIMSGYIRTKNAVSKNGAASLSWAGTWDGTKRVSGTDNWTKVSFEFDTAASDTIEVGPRLGHWYSEALGTAWYCDLSLEEMGPSKKAKR